jgi:hypothetical protein
MDEINHEPVEQQERESGERARGRREGERAAGSGERVVRVARER